MTLGTDGFGRSNTREPLEHLFDVDRQYVAIAALESLADDGDVPAATVNEAIRRYGADPDNPNPVTV